MDKLIELDLWRGKFNVTISGELGKYYGKWQETKGKRTPHGRAVFVCKDRYILGFVENGDWAVGSTRIIASKNINCYSVC